jgi:hypothetical protein
MNITLITPFSLSRYAIIGCHASDDAIAIALLRRWLPARAMPSSFAFIAQAMPAYLPPALFCITRFRFTFAALFSHCHFKTPFHAELSRCPPLPRRPCFSCDRDYCHFLHCI